MRQRWKLLVNFVVLVLRLFSSEVRVLSQTGTTTVFSWCRAWCKELCTKQQKVSKQYSRSSATCVFFHTNTETYMETDTMSYWNKPSKLLANTDSQISPRCFHYVEVRVVLKMQNVSKYWLCELIPTNNQGGHDCFHPAVHIPFENLIEP